MVTRPDPHVVLARRSETAARAWVVLVGVLVCLTTSPLRLTSVLSDDGPDDVLGRPMSLVGAIGGLLFADRGDFESGPAGGSDQVGRMLVAGRIGLVLVLLGLLLAVVVAITWLDAGEIEGIPALARAATGLLLVAGVLALVVACSTLGDPGTDAVRQGLDVGPGLWGPLGVTVALVARRSAPRWPWPGRHAPPAADARS